MRVASALIILFMSTVHTTLKGWHTGWTRKRPLSLCIISLLPSQTSKIHYKELSGYSPISTTTTNALWKCLWGVGGKQTQHISSNEEQEVADEVNRVS